MVDDEPHDCCGSQRLSRGAHLEKGSLLQLPYATLRRFFFRSRMAKKGMRRRATKVAIVGGGAAGKGMGRLLRKAGYVVTGTANRTLRSAKKAAEFIGAGRAVADPLVIAPEADILFLTVPDGMIETMAREIARRRGVRRGTIVVHCSGALSSEILSSLRSRGASVASVHPIRSFADPGEAVRKFKGTFCAYEGDRSALAPIKRLIADIGGIGFEVRREDKALYHAGAVFASNYLATVVDAALKLFALCGIEKTLATRSLLTLAGGTLSNIGRVGLPAALSGPVERGDAATIALHLAALRRQAPQLYDAYARLGRLTVEIALKKRSIDTRAARLLFSMFGGA